MLRQDHLCGGDSAANSSARQLGFGVNQLGDISSGVALLTVAAY
jgi:hypothetical protein